MGRGAGQQAASASGTQLAAKRRRGRPPRPDVPWTEQRIRTELAEFLAADRKDPRRFPSSKQFATGGHAELYHAARDHGGIRYWADQFGLELWELRELPAEVLCQQARDLVAKLGYLPGKDELHELGYRELTRAVRRAGGAERFAELHGLELPTGGRPAPGPYRWTDDRVRAELERFVNDRDAVGLSHLFPSAGAFEHAGASKLCYAIKRRGVAYWAAELGLELSPLQASTVARHRASREATRNESATGEQATGEPATARR
jgi:hypothetical protein